MLLLELSPDAAQQLVWATCRRRTQCLEVTPEPHSLSILRTSSPPHKHNQAPRPSLRAQPGAAQGPALLPHQGATRSGLQLGMHQDIPVRNLGGSVRC